MTDLMSMIGFDRPTPLAGDPDALARDAAMYGGTADAIDDALVRMREISSDRFSSDAVTALSRKQGAVAENISRAWARYRNVGDALQTYATRLRAAQDQANQAIAEFDAAKGQADMLAYPLQDAQQRASTPGPDQPFAAGDLARLSSDRDMAHSAMSQALQKWAQAVDAKNLAAKEAAIHVNAGNKANDLNDDLWDDLGDIAGALGVVVGFAKTLLRIVARALAFLGTVASVLSLIIPGIGAAAAALFAMAQVVNLAVAVLSVLQSVLQGANVFDAAIAAVAIAVGAVSTMAAAASAAAVGAAAARISAQFGIPIGQEQVREVQGEILDLGARQGSSLASLGGEGSAAIYADAAPALDPGLDRGIGMGVSSALGTGDRATGWWVRAAGLDSIPTSTMPGGLGAVVAGGVAGSGPLGADPGSLGAQQPSNLWSSMGMDAAKVFVPDADGGVTRDVRAALGPVDGSQAFGDLATGATHELLGSSSDSWAAAARHAVGGGSAGASAVGGLGSGIDHALPDVFGAHGGSTSIGDSMGNAFTSRVDTVTDAFGGAVDRLDVDHGSDRVSHYLGLDQAPPNPDGSRTADLGAGLQSGLNDALGSRSADGTQGQLHRTIAERDVSRPGPVF